MSKTDGWIIIPGWDRFQHYKSRNPIWIKLYTELLTDPDFVKLSFRQRGILTGLWTLFSQTRGQLGASPAGVGFMLGDSSVRARDLKALVDAGWIVISASRPLAIGYQLASPDKEKTKNPPSPIASRKGGTSPRQRGTNPRVTADNAPTFACDECSGIFTSQASLDQHRELAHIDQPRPAATSEPEHGQADDWLTPEHDEPTGDPEDPRDEWLNG